jgi:hypothetical protein
MMLETVNAALDNAPPPHTANELKTAGQTLLQALRTDLGAEMAKGTRMAEQFTRWNLEIETTLKDVLGTIPGA